VVSAVEGKDALLSDGAGGIFRKAPEVCKALKNVHKTLSQKDFVHKWAFLDAPL